jgi:hypothetical protein
VDRVAAAPTQGEGKERKWRKRAVLTAEVTKSAGPIIASVLALVISWLAYWDSHQADGVAAQDAFRSYASKVSYVLKGAQRGEHCDL